MKELCDRCRKLVDDLLPVGSAYVAVQQSAAGSAYLTAFYTMLLEAPYEEPQLYPCTDYVCMRCARELLGIADGSPVSPDRLADIRTEFLLGQLRGCLARAVVETVFQQSGYEVSPCRLESYLPDLSRHLHSGAGNIRGRKMRCSPDLFVYDRVHDESSFVAVKATTTSDETCCWISEFALRQYRLHWGEAYLIVYCTPSANIYGRRVEEIPIDRLSQQESPVTGYSNYVVNLKTDFETLPNCFPLIDPDQYSELCQSIQGVLWQFGQSVSSGVRPGLSS